MMLKAYQVSCEIGETSPEEFRSQVDSSMDESQLSVFDSDGSRVVAGKRQPSLRESLHATVDRYIALDNLRTSFGEIACAIIYGGSMQYGPFMNVRSGEDASDIDIVACVDSDQFQQLDWSGLVYDEMLSDADKSTLMDRLPVFDGLRSKDQVDIISQRFSIVDNDYTISTHIVPASLLERFFPSSRESLGEGEDRRIYVRDYKEGLFEHPCVVSYDMRRQRYEIPVENMEVGGDSW
jgi:hypothetical protein